MLERLLQKKVSVRLALLAVVIVALGGLAFGNIVRVAANGAKTYGLLGELALELASIPKNFKEGMRLVLEGEKKDLASAGTRFGTDKGFTFFTERMVPAMTANTYFSLVTTLTGAVAW